MVANGQGGTDEGSIADVDKMVDSKANIAIVIAGG